MLKASLLLAQFVWCVVLIVAGFAYNGRSSETLVYLLSCVTTGSFIWAIVSWRLVGGGLFDLYALFLGSLFLFNGGQTLLEIFDLNDGGLLAGRFDLDVTVATTYLVALAISATHLGALAIPQPASESMRRRPGGNAQGIRAVGWTLFAVSIIPACLELAAAFRIAAAGGYMALYQRDVATGGAAAPAVLATFIVPAGILLLAGAERRRTEKLVATCIISAHAMAELYLGYRSTAVMPIVAFAWLWTKCEFRIRGAALAAAAAAAIIVIAPIIRETRNLSGTDRFKASTLAETYLSLENPAVSTISEMGGSMGTVAYTYMFVPSTRPFDLGATYGYAALTVVPNVFWPVHPTVAHGLLSDWLVWTVDPYTAAHQGGYGYSCIAEAYLNFGWGGVGVMTVIGLCLAWLARSCATTNSRTVLAAAAIGAAFLLRMPRDESASLVRAVVWYSALPCGAAALLTQLGRRGAPRLARAGLRPALSAAPANATQST